MDARQEFIAAQQQMLDRFGVAARQRFVDVPSIDGRAQVLVCGSGPPVVMINGIGTPGAMWAPLMAELQDFQLFVIDLPSYGLTDTTPQFAKRLRTNAVLFLEEVLDALHLDRPAFVCNSLGSLWASWLALDRGDRVAALIHIGCPALALNTSAPLPMRVLSVPPLGKLITRVQPPSPKQVEQMSKMVHEWPLLPELVNLLVATERLPQFRHTFLSTLHCLLRLRGSRPAMTLTADQLARIVQPTLLFWGKDDPFGSPAVGARVAATMPAARLQMVGGGHVPWLTQSKVIGPIAKPFLHEHVL